MSNLNLYSLGLNDSTADSSIELTNKGGILLHGDSDATGVVTLDATGDTLQSFALVHDIITEDGTYFVETDVKGSVEFDSEISYFTQNNKAIITKSGDTVTNHNTQPEIASGVGTFTVVNSVTGQFDVLSHDISSLTGGWSNKTYVLDAKVLATSGEFQHIDLCLIGDDINDTEPFIPSTVTPDHVFTYTVPFGKYVSINKYEEIQDDEIADKGRIIIATDIHVNTPAGFDTLDLSEFTTSTPKLNSDTVLQTVILWKRTLLLTNYSFEFLNVGATFKWNAGTPTCELPTGTVEEGDVIFVTIPVLDNAVALSTSKTFGATVGDITTAIDISLGSGDKITPIPNDLTLNVIKNNSADTTIIPIVKVESQVTRKKLN